MLEKGSEIWDETIACRYNQSDLGCDQSADAQRQFDHCPRARGSGSVCVSGFGQVNIHDAGPVVRQRLSGGEVDQKDDVLDALA